MEKEYPVVKDDFERAGAASISIKEMLQQLGLSPELVRRVAIGTYEGEINCLIHGGGGKVLADFSPKAITVRVMRPWSGDPGCTEGHAGRLVHGFGRNPCKGFGAGMGLPNMKKVSDAFEIQTKVGEGTTVIMTFLCQ